MKKENYYKFLYITAILLMIGFMIRLTIDYFEYNPSYSAPFYLTIITRLVEFIVPSIIVIVAALKAKN